MVARRSWLAALTGLVLALVSCDFPTTVYGRLVLQPGTDGDVRLAMIELRDTADVDGPPVLTVTPDSGGRFNRCSFLFPVVEPGTYYLRAWQDRDNDGRLGNGDLAGVYGELYQAGLPGKVVMVYNGWTVDVGDIEMTEYAELRLAAAGRRVQGDSLAEFTYTFTNDVTLTSLDIAFPGLDPVPDASAPGKKDADSLYYSSRMRFGQGSAPTGLYTLTFHGLLDTTRFSRRAVVRVE